MKAYDNLLFQKKHFPQIFEAYTKITETESEISVSLDEENKQTCQVKDEILFVGENFTTPINQVLHIPRELTKQLEEGLEEYESIIIFDSYKERTQGYLSHGTLEFYYTHGYYLKNYKIRLVKKLEKRYLDKAIKVFVSKELDFYEKVFIKNYKYEIISSKDMELFKDLLLKFTPYHDGKVLSDKLISNENKMNIQGEDLVDEVYNTFLAMELCKYISSSISNNSLSNREYRNIVNMGVAEFSKEAMRILNRIIISSDFNRNFIIVETYLNTLEILEDKLLKFVENILKKELNRISISNSSNTDIYLELLKSKIILIDDLVKESVEELNLIVKEAVKKVG